MSSALPAFRLTVLPLAVVAWLGGCAVAAAEIRITISRYENGTLIVQGSTEPSRAVVLDDRARTMSDANGHFRFEETYKPETCMSDIVSGDDVYSAVIAGCFGDFAIESRQPDWKEN